MSSASDHLQRHVRLRRALQQLFRMLRLGPWKQLLLFATTRTRPWCSQQQIHQPHIQHEKSSLQPTGASFAKPTWNRF